MTAAEVEAYLHKHIPLSADMGVSVAACDPQTVVLRAPLAPNVNHRSTVFGGSASALAILAAWTWLHFSLRSRGIEARLVIQRNTMEYLAPITGTFETRSSGVPAAEFEKFAKTLGRLGRARLTVHAVLMQNGKEVGAFSGEYVALR